LKPLRGTNRDYSGIAYYVDIVADFQLNHGIKQEQNGQAAAR
jgi:hypothetical protein